MARKMISGLPARDASHKTTRAWGLPLTMMTALGVHAGALTAAKRSWFAMERPFDPLDEVDELGGARALPPM